MFVTNNDRVARWFFYKINGEVKKALIPGMTTANLPDLTALSQVVRNSFDFKTSKLNVLFSRGITGDYTISDNSVMPDNMPFTMTVRTNNPGTSNSTSFTLPLRAGETYNALINWGDGQTTTQTTATSPTHSYSAVGTYTVSIRGLFPAILFSNGGDRRKVLSIEQWGTLPWATMQNAFYGCSNMVINAVDTLILGSANCSSMFRNCSALDGTLNFDTSRVTNMSRMFDGCSSLNVNIDSFVTSAVTDMSYMFQSCSVFNQSVSNFDTSMVTNFSTMFGSCIEFNQSVSNFVTSAATDMSFMFADASVFNQSLSSFDTSRVTNMNNMLGACLQFNQSVSNFVTSAVTDMSFMFAYSPLFSQSVSNFDTSRVTNMRGMFQSTSFSGSLSGFVTSAVTNMSSMFSYCNTFNQSVSNFDTSRVTNMSNMFEGTAFNRSLSGFVTSAVTNMAYMFADASVFNQSLSSFDTSRVASMAFMFANASGFNQSISNFITTAVTDMQQMFQNAISFNQSLNSFDTSNVTGQVGDGFLYMFQNAVVFNQPVNHFVINPGAKRLTYMFKGAKAFNQDLSSWDVSNITQLWGMFDNATAFNQDIGSWRPSISNINTDFMSNKTSLDYSTSNYDSILNNWIQGPLLTGISWDFGTIKRTTGSTESRALWTRINSVKTITGITNNAGTIRVSMTPSHGMSTGNKVFISDVIGTTEANGLWTVTSINPTTVDLQGSTFTNAYVSGGLFRTGYGISILDGGI